MQGMLQNGDCSTLSGPGGIASRIISLMRVPVIQGMLREAYESDPAKRSETGGADGFIEVVEGWAFTLPAISACNASAAETLVRNMGNIGLGPLGAHVPDGFDAVLSAVESTYACLGIQCSDVNAMADPWQTSQTLWQPCMDPATTTTTTDSVETSASHEILPVPTQLWVFSLFISSAASSDDCLLQGNFQRSARRAGLVNP